MGKIAFGSDTENLGEKKVIRVQLRGEHPLQQWGAVGVCGSGAACPKSSCFFQHKVQALLLPVNIAWLLMSTSQKECASVYP